MKRPAITFPKLIIAAAAAVVLLGGAAWSWIKLVPRLTVNRTLNKVTIGFAVGPKPITPRELPRARYIHDDVQYFPPGPEIPWANTQAGTQRERMKAMRIAPSAPPRIAPKE